MANIILAAANESAVVAVEAAGLSVAPTLDVIAVVDAARAVVTLRAVNFGAAAVAGSVALLGCAVAPSGASGSVMILNASSSTATNLPWAPLLVAPISSSVAVAPSGAFDFSFPALSVVSISVPCVGAGSEHAFVGGEDAPSTCDAPSSLPQNFTSMGHTFEYFNSAAWTASPTSLSVSCNAAQCFDEGITTDAPLPQSGSASVSVSFPKQTPVGDDDAGLLLRCGLAGVGPGMDAFSCFEASLGPNKAGPGTGFVLLGAHVLPSSFKQLALVPIDVPPGAHVLRAALAVSPEVVTIVLSVDGAEALRYNDTEFLDSVTGGHVGLRSFFADVLFTGFTVSPSM